MLHRAGDVARKWSRIVSGDLRSLLIHYVDTQLCAVLGASCAKGRDRDILL